MNSLPAEGVTRFPPIVQVGGLVVLSFYVLVSIVGRLSPRFRWMWRDPWKRNRLGHIFEYTMIPGAILAVAVVIVAHNWDYRVPMSGGWAAIDLVLGPGAALLGGLLAVAGSFLGRDADEADPGALRSWLPFLLVVAGIVLMAVGIVHSTRVVKRRAGVQEKAATFAPSP